MRVTSAICLTLMICGVAFSNEGGAQPFRVGIFITIAYNKDCEHKLETIDKKKICITPRPVISKGDFAYITDLNERGKKTFFHLVLSDSGFHKLKTIFRDLPRAEFVLVADDMVVGFIKNLDVLRNRSLMIDAPTDNSDNLRRAHDKLAVVFKVKK